MRRSRFSIIWLSLFAMLLVHCASRAQLVETPTLVAENPVERLDGKIYAVADQEFISWAELVERAGTSEFVVLGEKHDNSLHHRYEMDLIKALSAQGKLGLVVFEMLASDQEAPLQASRSLRGDALKDALKWEKSGWDWQAYGPILEFVLDERIAVRPGNLARSEIMQRMRGGETVEEVERIPAPARDRLLDVLDEGHCGMVPRDRLGPMLQIQVARDVKMQKAMGAPGDRVVVLIAGRFHARRDLGVPLHLVAEHPNAKVASIGMVEVKSGKPTVRDYELAGAGSKQHDYLIFTEQAERVGDPCDELRRKYRGHSKSAAPNKE